MNNELQ